MLVSGFSDLRCWYKAAAMQSLAEPEHSTERLQPGAEVTAHHAKRWASAGPATWWCEALHSEGNCVHVEVHLPTWLQRPVNA